MPTCKDLRLGDVHDEHISILERLLGNGATIWDDHCGRKPSLDRQDARKGTEESVREALTTEQSMLEAKRPPEGGLAEMKIRLR